jgi:hypothetical protein
VGGSLVGLGLGEELGVVVKVVGLEVSTLATAHFKLLIIFNIN